MDLGESNSEEEGTVVNAECVVGQSMTASLSHTVEFRPKKPSTCWTRLLFISKPLLLSCSFGVYVRYSSRMYVPRLLHLVECARNRPARRHQRRSYTPLLDVVRVIVSQPKCSTLYFTSFGADVEMD